MHEVLADILVYIGLCAIVAGLLLIVAGVGGITRTKP